MILLFLSLRKEIKNLKGMCVDDNSLITLLQQGDKDAYRQLFIKYYSPFANMRLSIFPMMILKNLCRN